MIVFISSPYAGDIEKNTEAARRYCRYAVEQGHTPIAPHLLYPQFLDEKSEAERALGLQMGLQLLNFCDELWAFAGEEERLSNRSHCSQLSQLSHTSDSSNLSAGMKAEIAYAEENMIPIRYMSKDACGRGVDNVGNVPNITQAL